LSSQIRRPTLYIWIKTAAPGSRLRRVNPHGQDGALLVWTQAPESTTRQHTDKRRLHEVEVIVAVLIPKVRLIEQLEFDPVSEHSTNTTETLAELVPFL